MFGCGPDAARVRFANEFSCPSDQVEVVDLGANSYRVSGCGRQETYACAGQQGARVCVHDSGGGEAPSRAPRQAAAPAEGAASPSSGGPAGAWSRGRVRLASGSAGGQPALRLTVDSTYDATLTYAPARDVDVVFVEVAAPAAARGACDGAAIVVEPASVQLERAGGALAYRVALDRLSELPEGYLRFDLCGTTTQLVSTESGGVRRFFAEAVALREAARRGDIVSPEEPSAANEDAVRAWIESRRQVVLACVPQGPVVVAVVEQTPDGPVFSLRPPHHGTAEERCARAAVGTPPTPSSTVIHALNRE